MRRRGARRAEPIEDFEDFLAAPEAEDPHALSDAKKLMETLEPAPARHRPVDLARRPVDRGDRLAPRHDRGRRAGGAPPGAEIPRRGVAEVRVVKTSELIAALAADPVPEPIRMGRRFAAALASGLAGALVLYALIVGPRPDLAQALGTIRFNLKFVDALALALPSLLLLVRLVAARREARRARALALRAARPSGRGGRRRTDRRSAGPMAAPPRWSQHALLHDDDPDDGGADPGGAHLWRYGPARRSIRDGPGRSRARPPPDSPRSFTPRIAPTIRRCSWRPGIRWRRSSAPPPARSQAGVFWRGDSLLPPAGEGDPKRRMRVTSSPAGRGSPSAARRSVRRRRPCRRSRRSGCP